MAGGKFSLANLFGMTIRESANDGSDFTNPDADYRRLFLGEDGLLHVKDSAGTVTSPYSTSSSLSNATATPSAAPQTIGSAATPTDITGCSVSLAAGTWLIIAQVCGKRGSTDSAVAAAIADSSNAYYGTGRAGVIGTGGTQYCTIPLTAVVTPGSTTTYKLRVAFVSGTTGTVEISDGVHGNAATRITALKVA